VRCFDYFYRVLYNIAGAVSSTLAGDPQRLEAAILLRSPYGKSELVPFPFVHESGVRTSSAARSAWSTPTLQHIAQQTIRDSRGKVPNRVGWERSRFTYAANQLQQISNVSRISDAKN